MSVASQKHSVYVNSIDGLRAICCLGVLFYHMGFSWAQGGLMGVTTFFIISGYLITSGLLKEFAKTRSIDIKKFYVRRLWRLMPAVIVMVAGTAALCTLFNHILLTKMRPDIIPAVFMFINWSEILTQESYFQAAGLPSPLICFWSLAIEWQFYLVWPPVLLLAMRKCKRATIKKGLLIATAISALLMAILYVPGGDPTRVYYGTDTRLMSILLGCWLAFVWPFRRIGKMTADKLPKGKMFYEAMGFGSIGALILIMVFVDGFSPFSYYGGILLVSILSTAAVAAITPQGTVIGRIMAAKPLVWLGQRSYSLYLWHFPIVELLTNTNSTTGTPWYTQILMIVLSVLAADLSFRFVEEPLRRGGWFGKLKATIKMHLSFARQGQQPTRSRNHSRTDRPRNDSNATRRGDKKAHTTSGGRRAAAQTESSSPALLPKSQQIMAVVFSVSLLIGLIGVVFVPPVDAMGGTGDTSRATAATLKLPITQGSYDVVFIGDSVMLDVENEMAETFPHALIDCRVGRHAQEGLDVYRDYAQQGVVGKIVVFSLGSNSALTSGMLDEMVDAAGSDKHVWFVNNRMIEDFRDSNNELIAQCAATHPNVGVIDWYGISADQNGWFWQDGEHIRQGSDGVWAFVNLIKDTIKYEPVNEVETKYSVLFLGDEVPLTASDQLASVFPAGCIDCAEGRMPEQVVMTYDNYVQKNVVGNVVIVAVGVKEPFKDGALQSIVSGVGTDKQLYFVNVRMSARWCDSNNEALTRIANENGNVHVIDWYAASAGHDDYFIGDGTHLSDAGKVAYASVVGSAVTGDANAVNTAISGKKELGTTTIAETAN